MTSNFQQESIWKFALESIRDGVLITSYKENNLKSSIEIEYTNKYALSLLSCTLDTIEQSSIIQSEKFRNNVRICASSQQRQNFNIDNVQISCFPFDKTQIVIVLKQMDEGGNKNDSFQFLKSQERLHYLEYFNQICNSRCVIGEHIPEKNDVKVKFFSNAALKLTKLVNENVKDKLYFEDLKMKTSEESRNSLNKVEKKYLINKKLGPKTPELYLEPTPVTSRDGETRWILPNLHYLGDSKDGRRIIAVNSDDITNIMNLQISMQEFYVLKKLLDKAPIAVGYVKVNDAMDDGTYVFLNESLIRTLNVPNPKGMKISDLFPAHITSGWMGTFKRAIEEGKSSVMVESKIESKFSDNVNYHSYVIVPISDKSYCFLSNNITHRIQLEEELRHQKENLELIVKERTFALQKALETKSRFLSIMSHEIRTPMNGLLGMMSLISETNLTLEQKDMIRVADVCGQTLMNVIKDILDLSKLDAMQFQLENSDVEIQTLIENSLEIVISDAEKKNIELIWDIDPQVPSKIIGDHARLRQILVNLLSNSCKFSNRGDILVSVTSKKLKENSYEIQFSVKDEGIGISNDARGRLLAPFTQVDSGISRRFVRILPCFSDDQGGIGLGLAISKKLAELMGGQLWFDSELGVGSTFFFTVVTKSCGDKEPVSEIPDSNSESGCIGIIQFSELASLMIKKTLERNTSSPIFIFNSIEEFQRSEKYFRCALVNDKENWKNIKRLRSLENNCDRCPVIVIGNTKYDNITCIRKPIKKDPLLQAVKKFLGKFIQPKPDSPPPTSPVYRPSKLQILVAEDNSLNQLLLRKLLSIEGYSDVKVVENGLQAVAATEENDYDIILMDIMMPEMDGEQATFEIRNRLKKTMPIVALTAHVSDGKQYLQNGFNLMIPKPIDRKKLSEYLRDLNNKLYGNQ